MRILIADDDKVFLAGMRKFLTKRGALCFCVTDGRDARDILNAETIDAIVANVELPELDGIRLHSFVREFHNRNDVPFVFVLNSADPCELPASQHDFSMLKHDAERQLSEILDRALISRQR